MKGAKNFWGSLVEEEAQPLRRPAEGELVGGAWACAPTACLDVPTVADVLLRKSKEGVATGAGGGAAAALDLSSSSCSLSASLNREHQA